MMAENTPVSITIYLIIANNIPTKVSLLFCFLNSCRWPLSIWWYTLQIALQSAVYFAHVLDYWWLGIKSILYKHLMALSFCNWIIYGLFITWIWILKSELVMFGISFPSKGLCKATVNWYSYLNIFRCSQLEEFPAKLSN